VPKGKPNILVISGDDIGITKFPPRHEPASFSVDQAVEKLDKFLAKD
jgi:arylsulfatase A-like enzyme